MPALKLSVLLLALLLTGTAAAQHCPFDGGSLVAVKLVNAKGAMLNTAAYTAYLEEVDNPLADSCTYAPGLLKIKMLDKKAFAADCIDRYRNYSDGLQKRLQKKGVTGNANLFVIINQAETECMLQRHGDYDYQTRKFVVKVMHNGKTIKVPVPENDVRSLCTGTKGLEDFKPIVVSFGF